MATRRATPRPSRPRAKTKKAGEGATRTRVTFEGILLGALLVYAAHQTRFLLFEANYFKLQSLQIEGLDRLTEKQVVRTSGIELGMPSFRVDPELIAERVKRIPKVLDCVVEQPAPQSLLVRLSEKPEVARIVVDGRIHEVGPEGEIMLEAGFDAVTPLLLDAEIVEGPPRQLAPRHRKRLMAWLPVLQGGDTHDFSRIRFGGGGRLDVTWRGVRLVLDDPERFLKHRSFLGPVIADAKERGFGFEYVDLRFQDVVAKYRPLTPTERLGGAQGLIASRGRDTTPEAPSQSKIVAAVAAGEASAPSQPQDIETFFGNELRSRRVDNGGYVPPTPRSPSARPNSARPGARSPGAGGLPPPSVAPVSPQDDPIGALLQRERPSVSYAPRTADPGSPPRFSGLPPATATPRLGRGASERSPAFGILPRSGGDTSSRLARVWSPPGDR